jgi:hypothetical protein
VVRGLLALAEVAVDPAGLETLGQRRREGEGVEPQAELLWKWPTRTNVAVNP